MRSSSLFLGLSFLALGCSSSDHPATSGNSVATPPSASCRGAIPEKLTISEGGLVTFPKSADLTYEGLGGVVVTTDDTTVSVRAPYLGAANGDPGLQLGCGQTVPIELRALTWTSLATWSETTGANAREYGAWWLDTEGTGALVIFGGYHYLPKQYTAANDAWRFDFASATWSPLSGDGLPVLPGGRAAPIPGERAAFYFGGSAETADGHIETPPSLYRFDYDAQKLTPTKVDAKGYFPGSYTGSLIYDTKRKRWLSVCGVDGNMGPNCNVDAYTTDAGFTHLETAGTAPKGRYGFAYGYDEATDRVILFGGQVGQDNSAIDGETWALDLGVTPAKWTKLFADGKGPTKRRNGGWAMDPVGHRFFLWGGTPDGAKPVPNIQALSLERGAEAWSEIPMPKDVPPRSSGIGIYDAARSRIIWGFGNDGAVYRDLWSLDVSNVNPR